MKGAQLLKAINIEQLSQNNKRVIRRYRFTPPKETGRAVTFTAKGVEMVLDNFIQSFERDNPDHKYRLVVMNGGRYRLVWTPEPEPDHQRIALEKMVEDLKSGKLIPDRPLATA